MCPPPFQIIPKPLITHIWDRIEGRIIEFECAIYTVYWLIIFKYCVVSFATVRMQQSS